MQTATQTSRSTRLEARISPVQKALFQQAAALTGRTLSDLVVESTQDAATKIIQDHTIIRLSQEDQAAFVQALLNPPPISERLALAAERYKNIVTEKNQ